jgi:hypothetical protein
MGDFLDDFEYNRMKCGAVRPLQITFNHGVEGSSPSALTIKTLLPQALLENPPQGARPTTSEGTIWEGRRADSPAAALIA